MSRQAPMKGAVEDILEHHWSHSKVQHGSATWSSLSYQLWPNGSWTLGAGTEGLYDLFSINQSFTPLLDTSNATWYSIRILWKGNSGLERRVRFVRDVKEKHATRIARSQNFRQTSFPIFGLLPISLSYPWGSSQPVRNLPEEQPRPLDKLDSANIHTPQTHLVLLCKPHEQNKSKPGHVEEMFGRFQLVLLCASFFSLFHLSSLCKLELSQAQPPLGSRRCRHASRSNEWGTIQLDPAYIELKLSTAANQEGKVEMLRPTSGTFMPGLVWLASLDTVNLNMRSEMISKTWVLFPASCAARAMTKSPAFGAQLAPATNYQLQSKALVDIWNLSSIWLYDC